jgi:hypothetical protein
MGVTYKAFDVDLHCPVTLKVIAEQYLGDESARVRFLREARAAASIRYPNVASVLHLGRTGSSYFYAMEFVSVARLPVTGSELFGREEEIAFLDAAWANPDVNVVTIVAWAGVGKSTLVNHWLRRMAVDQYRCAEHVFGWSFYRQGASGETSSADEFLDAALTWFGDPDPRLGTAWEKGERLARLIAHRRTLLVLDAWSRSKIRRVHEKDSYVSLPSRHSCVNSLLSIAAFA